MCTYATTVLTIDGSAKGKIGWFSANQATVYFDHPVHFARGHALMVDLAHPSEGPSARVGLELSPESARALAVAILDALDAVPPALFEADGVTR